MTERPGTENWIERHPWTMGYIAFCVTLGLIVVCVVLALQVVELLNQ